MPKKKNTLESVSTTSYTIEPPYYVGQPVKVISARTEGRRGLRWTYLRHVVNNSTNSSWIDVLDKDGIIRSFKSSEVSEFPLKRKRKDKNSI